MKAGDWECQCGEHVFASRTNCRQCGASKPSDAGGGGGYQQGRPGDWTCSCGELCFASRTHCRKCNAEKPTTD